MFEAIWYGTVAALAFIGFLALVYFVILSIYKPGGSGRYILVIPEDADKNKISNLVYGAHMRNILFGDLVCDDIYIVDCGLDEEKKRIVKEVSADCGGVKICAAEDLSDCLYRKENDGRKSC